MRKHYRNIEALLKLAMDAHGDHECKANHVSCIIHRNEVVSFGFNARKTHPFQAKYGKNTEAIFWHSEVHAIHNALKRISEEELSRATLYVVRVKADNAKHSRLIPAMSKPCDGCMRAIRDYKLKEVIYTEDSDEELIYSTIMRK